MPPLPLASGDNETAGTFRQILGACPLVLSEQLCTVLRRGVLGHEAGVHVAVVLSRVLIVERELALQELPGEPRIGVSVPADEDAPRCRAALQLPRGLEKGLLGKGLYGVANLLHSFVQVADLLLDGAGSHIFGQPFSGLGGHEPTARTVSRSESTAPQTCFRTRCPVSGLPDAESGIEAHSQPESRSLSQGPRRPCVPIGTRAIARWVMADSQSAEGLRRPREGAPLAYEVASEASAQRPAGPSRSSASRAPKRVATTPRPVYPTAHDTSPRGGPFQRPCKSAWSKQSARPSCGSSADPRAAGRCGKKRCDRPSKLSARCSIDVHRSGFRSGRSRRSRPTGSDRPR